MRGQVIQDHNVPGPKRRRQNLFCIGVEPVAGHGAVQDHGRGHARQAQTADEGGGLPMPVGNGRAQSLASGCAAVKSGHLCARPGFVQEYQSLRIKFKLAFEP